MRTVTKIACRTMGTLGMGIALYDSVQVGSQFSRIGAEKQQAKYLENVYFNSRTTDTVSYSANALREKTFDMRSKNPLPSFWGRLKGGVQGSLYSLGNHIVPVVCSAVAILSKGFMAKAGAAGVGLSICYNILRNGFGLGKQNPMS